MNVHVSIPVNSPKEIAQFLARVIDGEAIPFPPVAGAWVTVPRDGSGHTIEIYPVGTILQPGRGSPDPSVNGSGHKPWEAQISQESGQTMVSGHHLALSTKVSREEVLRLGQEMGFRTVATERNGIFELIEIWIEGKFLVEVITERELTRYLAFWRSPDAVKERFGNRAVIK